MVSNDLFLVYVTILQKIEGNVVQKEHSKNKQLRSENLNLRLILSTCVTSCKIIKVDLPDTDRSCLARL